MENISLPDQVKAYLTNRVDDQISWYNNKSGWNKRQHYLYQVITLVCGALTPLLAGYITAETPAIQYTTQALGAAVVISQGIQSLKKFKDHWLTYRGTAEMLQREKLLFLNTSGKYAELDEKQAFRTFVEQAETIMSSENSAWVQAVNRKDDEKAGGG